jgi:formylglycine-generating enzyme
MSAPARRLSGLVLTGVIFSAACGRTPATGDGRTDDAALDGSDLIEWDDAGEDAQIDSCDAGDVDSDADVDPYVFDVCPGPEPLPLMADCAHPVVEARCSEGWCRVPAGCFLLGAPEGEPMRGAYSETITPVTLTREFEIGQYEVTQGEWTAAGFPNPSGYGPDGTGACAEPSCPVEDVTWFEALAYANRLSELHAPPLDPCYRLDGCTGDVGSGVVCTDVETTSPTIYDCEGYRLPTVAEWEYSARAGTWTSFYSGPICARTDPAQCLAPDPCLEPIAWYCMNSGDRTHPVGEKLPNGWGLYDILGNVGEWANDEFDGLGYGGLPIIDPTGPNGREDLRAVRGGASRFFASTCRAGGSFALPPTLRGEVYGFRLARTLP